MEGVEYGNGPENFSSTISHRDSYRLFPDCRATSHEFTNSVDLSPTILFSIIITFTKLTFTNIIRAVD